MTRLLVLVWVAALLYALFLTAKLVTRRARLTDRPFLIRWMVAWAAMLALSTAIRVTAPRDRDTRAAPGAAAGRAGGHGHAAGHAQRRGDVFAVNDLGPFLGKGRWPRRLV